MIVLKGPARRRVSTLPARGRMPSIDTSRHWRRAPVLRYARLAAATLVIVALAGCALGRSGEPEPGGPGGPGAPAAPDPCQLLTSEEVQQVRGGVTQPGVERPGDLKGERSCRYDQAGSLADIRIDVYPSAQEYFDGERESARANFPVEEIDGLGDEAFISATVLFIYKDPFTVVMVVSGPETEAEKRDLALKLGAVAVGRL